MTIRSRAMLATAAAALLLTACDGDDGAETGTIDIEDPSPGDATDEDPTGETAGESTDGADDADTQGDPSDGTDAEDASTDEDTGSIATARTGTWPVGDAGSVTFEVEGGSLVLVDHQASEGWEARVEEEDDDEIEIDFRRDDVAWEFEVELDDGQLEIEIRQDHLDAEAGAYDLPDGGAFTFEADGSLVLVSVTAGDGWEVTEQEEESDEIELSLRSDDREVEVEVELDDGRIEVEIDYEVTGPVDG